MAVDTSSQLYRAILANATMVGSHMSTAAQEDQTEAIEHIIEARWQEEQRIIDEQNRRALEERERHYKVSQRTAYALSRAQMADARRQAQEYELLAEDFVQAAGVKRARMGSAYSASGALMAGSALVRTRANKQRAEQGAARLSRAARYAIKRGETLSRITKAAVTKIPYVPIPDAIKQSYVPPFIPKDGSGGRIGGVLRRWSPGGFDYTRGPGNPFFFPSFLYGQQGGYWGPNPGSAVGSGGSGGSGIWDDVSDTLGGLSMSGDTSGTSTSGSTTGSSDNVAGVFDAYADFEMWEGI